MGEPLVLPVRKTWKGLDLQSMTMCIMFGVVSGFVFLQWMPQKMANMQDAYSALCGGELNFVKWNAVGMIYWTPINADLSANVVREESFQDRLVAGLIDSGTQDTPVTDVLV